MTAAQKFEAPNDLIAIWRHYVHEMLTPAAGEQDPSSKALVADEHTLRMITIACPMSVLTQYRVYDIRTLDKVLEGTTAEQSRHETAYVLLRPTPLGQEQLMKLMQLDPFHEYHIVYTNRCDESALVSLATHDTSGPGGLSKIASIREMFADFAPLDRHLFLAPPPSTSSAPSTLTSLGAWKRSLVDSALAAAAGLRCAPVIRFQNGSPLAKEVAEAINDIVTAPASKGLFDFKNKCTVLVLDRAGDAMTPLLTPWTYEAMLHEFLPNGIRDNTVSYFSKKGQKEEFAVGPCVDDFYAEHAGDDYGAVGNAVTEASRRLVAATGDIRGGGNDLSVAAMREKMEAGTFANTQKALVARHLGLYEEITDVINRRHLLEIGAHEQNIAAGSDGPNQAIANVRDAANDAVSGKAASTDVRRLALVASLRHEASSREACDAARNADNGGSGGPNLRTMAAALIDYGGAARRPEDLFGGLLGSVRRMIGGGDMLTYLQHTPLLRRQLDALSDGKLDKDKYPTVRPQDETLSRKAASQIVVIMIGGATYSEAQAVRSFNASKLRSQQRAHAVLGTTSMLTTSRFVEMLQDHASR